MKFIRNAWQATLNLGLILIPLIVTTLFAVRFGQPFFSQFKKFLGSPIRETSRLTDRLKQQPSQPVPFVRLRDQFQQVTDQSPLSDTDALELRKATLNIHQAVINRLSQTNSKTASDTYIQFINHDSIQKIFPRGPELTVELQQDLNRVRSAGNLPFYEVRGLPTFIDQSDTASHLIKTYGELYANELRCRQLTHVNCERIYTASAGEVANHLTQYFDGWPNFGDAGSGRPGDFLNQLRDLLKVYRELFPRSSSYLETAPWNQYDQLLQNHERLRVRFRNDLRDRYERILRTVQFNRDQFSSPVTDSLMTKVNSLIKLEQFINQSDLARQILRDNPVNQQRKTLSEIIERDYVWNDLTDRFDPTFTTSESLLEGQQKLIKVLPGGTDRLDAIQEQVNSIITVHSSLVSAVDKRGHGLLYDTLKSLQRKRLGPDKPGWNIMVRTFLNRFQDRFSNPDWQPESSDRKQQYSELIKLVGAIATNLEIEEYSPKWAENTLLAMRSRRYNELKRSAKNKFENYRPNRPTPLVKVLQQVWSLEDLPGELGEQQRALINRIILAEKIVYGSDHLYDHFQTKITGDEIWTDRYATLRSVLQPLRNQSLSSLLNDQILKQQITQLVTWEESLKTPKPYDGLIQRSLTQFVSDLLDEMASSLIRSISNPDQSNNSSDALMGALSNLELAQNTAATWEDFSRQIDTKPWQNLVKWRQQLNALKTTVDNISGGSMFSENTTFDEFKSQLSSTTPETLPGEYQPNHELDLLENIHSKLLDKARSIHQQSQEEWFSGWGGRLQGAELLRAWSNYLDNLQTGSGPRALNNQVSPLDRETQSLIQQWDDSNG